MDTVLIAVTVISLALAIGMGVVVAMLLRADRARSEARVAALSAMAAAPVPAMERVRPVRPAPPAPAPPVPPRPTPAAPVFPAVQRIPSSLADMDIRPGQTASVQPPGLFAAHDQPSTWGPRLAVVAMLVVGLAIVGFAMMSGAARRAAAVPPAAVANTVPAETAPLELLSLRHAQEGQNLTITGLVRNPRTGASLSRLVATAFVFAADGTFLASSRAPLDVTALAAGDESPFVVTVPVTGEVSRYRIGFRTEDGQVIAHVDKRAPEALASTSPQ
ncbi:MAG: hypothetical protein ABJC89_23200 [Acidobacteriota bacterium]